METRDILNAFLEELLNGVKEAGAFVKDQLPLVLQEYVTWGIVSGLLYALGGMGLMYAGYRTAKWALKGVKDCEEGNEGAYIMPIIFLAVPALIGGGVMTFGGATNSLQAAVAPRVYIIEQLSSLVK